MKLAILLSCFLPLIILFIVMKLAVWASAVNKEKTYVEKEPLRKRGPYMEAYVDVDDEEDDWT